MGERELRDLIVETLTHEVRAGGQLAVPGAISLEQGNLDLTSLELVRLLVTLEEKLDIELADVAIMNANFETLDDVVAVVGSALSSAGRIGSDGRRP